MATNIVIDSSDWVDLRTRGYVSGQYLSNRLGPWVEYSTAASPTTGTRLIAGANAQITGTYLWVRGAGAVELISAAELQILTTVNKVARTDLTTGQPGVATIVTLTQAAYDALAVKVADTLYVVVG